MNRNDIKKIIKEHFIKNQISENQVELFTKYHLNEKIGENEKIQLIDNYNNIIKNNKQILSQKIDTDKIKTLIMFLSISPIKNKNEIENILDENILNKNLKVFENIQEFIIIYSSESKQYFELLEKEYVGINFTPILADFSNGYNDIERKVKYILKDRDITKENTIIDLTLGMKYVSIFFYKLAVENDIYAINWYTEQLIAYEKNGDKDEYSIPNNKFFKRLPFTTRLKIMIEPRKENSRIYSQINTGIKEYNFSLVENLYEKVGNKNMKIFFRELKKLYSFENMITLDRDNFYNSLEDFFRELTDNITKDIIIQGKIKKFLEYMFALIYYEENNEEEEELEPRNFSWKTKFLKLFSFDEKSIADKASYLFFERDKIYFYLVLEFFKNNKREDFYSYDRFLLKMISSILRELDEPDIPKEKLLKNSKMIFDINIDEELENIDTKNILTENIKGDFYFKNNILYIEKFGLSINVKEYSELDFIWKKGFKLLLELLEIPDEEINGKILYGKLTNLSKKADYLEDEKEKGRFRKNLTTLKNKIKDFNQNIKEIAKKDNIILPDIIIYQKDTYKTTEVDFQHSIKINPEIYNLI
ncbi:MULTISPECIES: hypothetical protein [Fusobacterium]|uniref:hypothetical protein n=1 Tax=Fusobacterium TaxID=848 RepID=UPI001F337363|nr:MULTISPECIES: hypothetical protein [Fusobacterium]MCF2612625.1 hypothetical protein [Fusobacterium perfoetens]MDY2981457.1 hypothetical protein [Fusobacterium sp.]